MAQRRTLPGGLRAQFLLALTALLVGAFALAGLAVENAVSRRLHEARMETAYRVAELALVSPMRDEASLARFARAAGVDYVAIEHTVGAPALTAGRSPGELSWRGEEDEHRFTQVGQERWLVVRLVGPELAKEVVVEARAVVVGISLDELYARLAETRALLWPLFVLVGVFILAFGYAFFTFFILRPIRAIGVATERAADGDLASPIALEPANEIGRVARSFNRMLQRLEDNRVELEARLEALEWANEELTRAQNSLVRSEKLASVGQLAAGVAHEVGNPLAAVSGYNELMRDGDLSAEEIQDLLARTGVQLDRIRGIIRNLLDFSREESAQPEPTDLAACIEEAVSLVSALPRARAVSFEVEVDTETTHVEAVPAHVVQVLVNLALNAVDAMSKLESPRVSFRIERRESADDSAAPIALHVDDIGPGIPPDELTRIFDPFYTTKEPGEGTGLGLAISSRIMESFGGELQVESEPGHTRFTLLFPRSMRSLTALPDAAD